MTQVELRLPELGGGSEEEQLQRIRTYLFALTSQLQFALDGVNREQDSVRTEMKTAAQQEKGRSFSSLKSLILRSAEITEHFEEQIEQRLSGKYAAQSQFGLFEQQTDQKITASSEQLRQEFSHFQQLQSELEEIRSSVLEVQASIRTGVLFYRETGEPVYGMEIGQKEWADGLIRFRKFARLTSDRLSFFDSNDVEVAFVSDRRLHVTGATMAQLDAGSIQVTRLQMGDYVWQLGTDGHLSLR